MTTSLTHFLEYIYTDVRANADQPVLYEKQGSIFQIVTKRETTARIADFARALYSAGVVAGDRTVFYAAASPALLIGEWGVLANRGIAIIVPRSFSPEDLIEILVESKSTLAIVDRLATAYQLAEAGANLPDLKRVVCIEGAAQSTFPIVSWADFIDSARMEPDRSAAGLRSIAGKDTALMFYFKDAKGKKQATRYTHSLLLDHISRIGTLLAKSPLKAKDLVLTATAWEQPIGHIAACYAPLPSEALIQITHAIPDVSLFETHPHVTVGDAAFFDGIRENIVHLVRQSGQIESMMLKKALSFSKASYESPRGIRPFTRLQQGFLKTTIVKKVRKLLGDNLRLFIGTDNEAHYETQLFFHTFGVDLVELPQEVFR